MMTGTVKWFNAEKGFGFIWGKMEMTYSYISQRFKEMDSNHYMKIEVICVGKLKEKYLVQAIQEYSKRLSRYCKLSVTELADEKTPDNASEKEELMIKDKEGEKILSKISDSAYVVALDLNGKMLSSEELAAFMSDCAVRGNSHLVFVIGGSLGLSEAVRNRANYKLCFSKMTFPHQLFRVMLLEQIYRGFRINNNEPYHK